MDIPRRPPVIIRPPERADKTPDKSIMDSSAGQPSTSLSSGIDQHHLTVYTNIDVCRFSQDILDELGGIMFNHVEISKADAPSWLPGTPTVVHKSNVYCGDAAFAFVQNYEGLQKRPTDANPAAQKLGNPFAKRQSDVSFGCGLAKAFAPPSVVEVDESKFAESTEDAMQRLLAARR